MKEARDKRLKKWVKTLFLKTINYQIKNWN
jgi:hypothetical protein